MAASRFEATPGRYSPGQGARAYRPDIDGLRAIAVLLVVLDHVGFRALPGGYVGVDVFMVISGFLITGMITTQRREGRFTFRDFYVRRAKRLLPALYVMMLATLAVGYVLMIPSDYSLLAESALASVALAANIFFWIFSGGYFAPDAAAMPLLHIWSLSLEEQFYLVWPAVLLLLMRLPSARLRQAAVAALMVASFAFAQYCVARGFTSAYFLLPQRGGEFLAGALLSLAWREPQRASPAVGNAVGLLGLGLIAASAVLLDARAPFPGLSALPVCLGSAMVIAAAAFGPNLATRALSLPPMVFVGLISYSVYLWHWPLVSFVRYQGLALSWPVAAGVVVASLALGYLSWRFIETGYRATLHKPGRLPRIAAGLATAGLLLFAAVVVVRDGLPGRFPYALPTQEQLTAERNRYWRELPAKRTKIAAGAAGKRIMVVGDSHAYDHAYALTENGLQGRVQLLETSYQCFNFGHDAILASDRALCAEGWSAVLNSRNLRAASVVHLHDHWGAENTAALAEAIREIRARTPAPIYVFGPKMMFTDDVLAISRMAQTRRRVTAPAINAYAQGYRLKDRAAMDRRLQAWFAAHPQAGVTYISTLDIQCGREGPCDVLSPDGAYLYFDSSHFTLLGSRLWGRRLKAAHPELF